jgi:lipopolysaccharide transport system permease protein
MRASVVEIQATRGIPKLGLGKLWRFRDLIYFFAWRDVKVRYKQTLFEAIIQPFAPR